MVKEKKLVEFSYNARNWTDPKLALIDLAESIYNQFLPIIGVLLVVLYGNYWGLLLCFPLFVTLHFDYKPEKNRR